MTTTRTAPDASGLRREDTNHPHAGADAAPLSIPKELWSAPVSEARWCGVRPRLSWSVLLLPLAALISAYVAAAAAAHGRLQLAGWLLALAVTAILTLAVAIGRHAHRVARYRTEAPR